MPVGVLPLPIRLSVMQWIRQGQLENTDKTDITKNVQFDNTLLKHLVPIKQLQSEHRLKMADQSHIIDLRVGDELSSNEEHRWFEYLLDGKIDMFDESQRPTLLTCSDERAFHPLFGSNKRNTRLIAQSSCQIIRFDKELFNAFLDQEILTGEELETVEMSEVEGNLFNEIMHAFNMGKLKLPSLPEIAVKVKAAVLHPSTSAEDIALIISADPVMAIKLINAANGPLNRGVEQIDNIQAAVIRLGMKASKELVMSFAVKHLFMSKSPTLNQRMKKLYEHSSDVAAISFALSKQSGLLSPDHMLLAGLLHEIGVIPILSYIEDTGLIIEDEGELESIIDNLRGVVGSMVIRHWDLPADLDAVVEDFEDWHRESGGAVDTCDMIIVAKIYSRLKDHKIQGLPRIDQVPAFKKVFPGHQDADFATKMFEQAQDEITAIRQLLKM